MLQIIKKRKVSLPLQPGSEDSWESAWSWALPKGSEHGLDEACSTPDKKKKINEKFKQRNGEKMK